MSKLYVGMNWPSFMALLLTGLKSPKASFSSEIFGGSVINLFNGMRSAMSMVTGTPSFFLR